MIDIRPLKSLGQNFLVDKAILLNIVGFADLNENDVVIEIGAGKGDLTALIADKVRVVIALELDRRLIPLLEKRFKGSQNVKVICSDALQFNYFEASNRYKTQLKIIGNIPYYISTALTIKLLKMGPLISVILFMFQREIGERIIAQPGRKTFGPLSIFSQVYSDVKKIMEVERTAFSPQPKVDSSLVKFVMYREPRIKMQDKEHFEKTIHYLFGQRRKTLINVLSAGGKGQKKDVVDKCISAGIDPMRRAETLTLDEIDRLVNILW
jgi:16S rRNA (adenine1518-N6/adenine1519-N6)-dimethyltransferase